MNFFDVLYNQKYQAKRGAYPDRLFGEYTQTTEVTTPKGPIANFKGNGTPLVSLVADIDPIQDLHGQDELATPITIDLTPTEVKTLLGENNVWADSGEVEVTYKTIKGATV